MDLAHLMDFTALARYRNFSRAAAARSVTQPAFSRRIKALEDWVGTPLFVRGSQGCSLTAAGEHFNAHVDAIILRLLELRESALNASMHDAQTLRIAATQTIAFAFFPGWISQARESADIGLVQLNSGNLAICSRLLLDEKVQMLLCHVNDITLLPFAADAFDSVVVGEDSLILVSGVSESGQPFFTQASQQPLPLLDYTRDSGIGRIVEAKGDAKLLGMRTKSVFSTHLAASLLPLVKKGQGVAWLPLSLIGKELQEGSLGRFLPVGGDIGVEVRLFRAAGALTGVARNLWEYARRDAGGT